MRMLFVMCSILGGVAFGSEILSVDFKPELLYRDLERSCEFSPQVRLFNLTAELEEGQIVRARLKKNTKVSKPASLDLTEQEIQTVLTQVMTKENKPLIQRFEASERMLKFFFFESFIVENPCVPKDSISDFSPSSVVFEYSLPHPGSDPLMYDDVSSNVIVVNGHNVKKHLFRIELSLTQAG